MEQHPSKCIGFAQQPAGEMKPVCLCCSLFFFTPSLTVSPRHTLPISQWKAATGKTLNWYHESLGDGCPVIIYLHGNVGTRWDKSSTVEILKLILTESGGNDTLHFCLSMIVGGNKSVCKPVYFLLCVLPEYIRIF